MSDTRLRELERRWKETGSVEDEAAYLLERVRVGDLTQERLELAAAIGYAPASSAVGRPCEVPLTPSWLQGLSELNGGLLTVSAVACAFLSTQAGSAHDELLNQIGSAFESFSETDLDTIDRLERKLFDRTDRPSRRIWNVVRAVNVLGGRRADLEDSREGVAMTHLRAALRGIDSVTNQDLMAKAVTAVAGRLLGRPISAPGN